MKQLMVFFAKITLVLLLFFLVVSCGGKTPKTVKSSHSQKSFTGVASWYGLKFHGRQTASGERFNMHAMTCAHKTLPFGTELQVTHLNGGQSVKVRVNDRGPFVRGRVIDLSYAAANKIGILGSGHGPVRVQVVN